VGKGGQLVRVSKLLQPVRRKRAETSEGNREGPDRSRAPAVLVFRKPSSGNDNFVVGKKKKIGSATAEQLGDTGSRHPMDKFRRGESRRVHVHEEEKTSGVGLGGL